MEYLQVGKIINTFGIKGELKIDSMTDFPKERFRKDNELYIFFENRYQKVVSGGFREYKGFILFKIRDCNDINLVEKYKGSDIFVDRSSIHKLDEGQFYFFQLKQCDVYADDRYIGKVSDVEEGYQTIIRIKTEEKEILIPYVKAFIKNVDMDSKRIDINLIEGLL